MGQLMSILDKDSDAYMTYQLELKQYLRDIYKYRNNLEKCFSVIYGQCNPSMK